ncbi:MAG: NAD(P)-dependent oxidoreductase [Litorilinea sp.]
MTEQTASPQNVLVTGAAGAIGRNVCEQLQARGHTVRGFDINPNPDVPDFIQANLTDAAAVQQAMQDIDTVVHLAAYPVDADFMTVLLEPNVIGLYQVCNAAREASVRRLILASTIQTVWGFPPDKFIRIEDGTLVGNHYALSKVWAEQMGDMYARVHNMEVINVRILWLARSQEHAEALEKSGHGVNIYFSHDDAKRFFQCAVEADQPKPGECVTVFAGSKPLNQPRVDMEPARRILGYEPQDTFPEGMPYHAIGKSA